MIVRFVLWNLADSMTTIEELRRYLRDESVDAWEDVDGPAVQGLDLRPGDGSLGRDLLLGVRGGGGTGAAVARP